MPESMGFLVIDVRENYGWWRRARFSRMSERCDLRAETTVRNMRDRINPCYIPNNVIANGTAETEFPVGAATTIGAP